MSTKEKWTVEDRWNIKTKDGKPVALVFSDEVSPHWEERDANANLIASAPDLYEALDRLVKTGRVYEGGNYGYVFEALAKAEGKEVHK